MKRKIYLKMHTLKEAQALFETTFRNHLSDSEFIDSRECLARVTAEPVFARFSSPSFHGAAMDGLAVSAEDTFGAGDDSPITLNLTSGQAVFVNTGFPLPEGKNSVIMIEHTLLDEDQSLAVIRAPVFPWQNVRKTGEDIVATELLFPCNHRLTPPDIGALLTAGCPRVQVWKKPHLTIIPTGNELIRLDSPDQEIPPGKTVESNSAVLAAMAQEAGALTHVTTIISDEYRTIKARLQEALASGTDIVLINAGSSAGSADYTAAIIEELGTVLVHGVTMMPGKPTILGIIDDIPVIGNPGYPVSAIISFEQFVIPLIRRMVRTEQTLPEELPAQLAQSLPSRSGMEEFRRMITGRIDDRFVTLPLKKGAGAITTLTRANTMLRIPPSSEGLDRDSTVTVQLLRPRSQIERTILCTGSHDLCLEMIRDFLNRSTPSYPLASTHVGSLGGILAIRDGNAHLAGSHLLDPETGEYNICYLKQYLPEMDAALITLVHREQGFMVSPGNPKRIRTVEDLSREDVMFVNRQAGSGTRVLLDYELKKAGISPGDIRGYDGEEHTHMAVAVRILSKKADVGLGILAAARALKLDFIPLAEERYDLIIPNVFLKEPNMTRLLDIINDRQFRERVMHLGGYSTRETGNRILWA